jgi:hypothetical protein
MDRRVSALDRPETINGSSELGGAPSSSASVAAPGRTDVQCVAAACRGGWHPRRGSRPPPAARAVDGNGGGGGRGGGGGGVDHELDPDHELGRDHGLGRDRDNVHCPGRRWALPPLARPK